MVALTLRKFQKSEASLEYIEKRLKLDFINKATENGCPAEESPVVMLENLMTVKAKQAALSRELQELLVEQKKAMSFIRANMDTALNTLRLLQQSAELKVHTSCLP